MKIKETYPDGISIEKELNTNKEIIEFFERLKKMGPFAPPSVSEKEDNNDPERIP